MKAWMLEKNKHDSKHIETTAKKINNEWVISGEYANYKEWHYIIENKGIEYTLKNGRLIKN